MVIFCIVEDGKADAMAVMAVVEVAIGKVMLGIVKFDMLAAMALSVFESRLLCRFRKSDAVTDFECISKTEVGNVGPTANSE